VLNNDAVESIFYNNLAMERSTNGDDKNAFLYLKRALIANNNESFIWSNLGAIYRRRGDLQIAEVVYLKALSLNQQDYTVLHNLAVLYKKMGNQTKADFYQEQVQHYREQNPYYLYQMAKNAKSNGNIASAKNLIARALKKQIHDERFYLFAAELYETEGNTKQSKKMRDKAESLKQASLNTAGVANS
jgi:Flp pilus assembly protein TadD